MGGALESAHRKKRIVLPILKIVFELLDVTVHCTSAGESRAVSRLLSKSRIVVIPPAIDAIESGALPAEDRRNTRTRHPESTELRLLFVSRIDPKKNLDGALRTVSQVTQHVHFRIVGPCTDNRYMARCREIADSSPRDHTIDFVGGLNHEAVNAEYDWADLFFLPTKGENFGHAIREALSHGCPTLISNSTPWTDLVNAAGIDTPEWRQEEAFARIIQHFAANRRALENAAEEIANLYGRWVSLQMLNQSRMLDLFLGRS